MKTFRLEWIVIQKLAREVLAATLAWAVVCAPTMAAAQEKSRVQKEPAAKQTQAAPPAKLGAEKETDSPKERPGGPQEGIKVHGHWTITIRNQDGSVASRHEFNNSLYDGTVLGRLLTGAVYFNTNSWLILLNEAPAAPPGTGFVASGDAICGGPLFPSGFLALPCILSQGTGTNNNGAFYGLSVSPTATGLVMAGSLKASQAGKISFVTTGFATCGGTPTTCNPSHFTTHDLTTPTPPFHDSTPTHQCCPDADDRRDGDHHFLLSDGR